MSLAKENELMRLMRPTLSSTANVLHKCPKMRTFSPAPCVCASELCRYVYVYVYVICILHYIYCTHAPCVCASVYRRVCALSPCRCLCTVSMPAYLPLHLRLLTVVLVVGRRVAWMSDVALSANSLAARAVIDIQAAVGDLSFARTRAPIACVVRIQETVRRGNHPPVANDCSGAQNRRPPDLFDHRRPHVVACRLRPADDPPFPPTIPRCTHAGLVAQGRLPPLVSRASCWTRRSRRSSGPCHRASADEEYTQRRAKHSGGEAP